MPAFPKKPAVLHVLEAMEGGTRRHVCDLLPQLSARGYSVALATSFRRNPALRDDITPALASCGIPVHELPMRRAIAPLADARAALRLSRLVRTLNPDILHTHSAKAGILGRLTGAAHGIPVVHTPHAFPFLMEGGRCKKGLYRFFERLAQPTTAALIAVSQEEARAAREIGFPPGRIHHIPNGIGTPPQPPPATPPLQAIAFFGRLSRQKGVDLLLRAVANLDIETHIHGRGEDEAALRRQCQSRGLGQRVRFMGECPQSDITARMRDYPMIVIPSRWEGCPYVVLDAFAAGVPVLATRVGGIPDLIQDGANGTLIPAEDVPALSAAIAALLQSPTRRRGIATAAQQSLSRHTLTAMADSIERVYHKVAMPSCR